MRPRAIRATLLAACISASLAHAEDGAMPAPGNVLNPAPVNPSTAGRWMDEEGMGTRIPAARSPIGRLYNMPLDAGGEAPARDVPGWINSAYIEFGLVRSSGTGTRGIPGYLDFDSGIYLNTYALTAEKPSEARFFEATGGAAGRDDQFHHVQFGRYNDWKVTAWFDGSPMALTSNYRSLWGGTGTSSLNLSTLTPGGGANAAATQTAIQNALAATPPGELDIVRRRAGVRLDSHLSTSWRMFASFVDDKRDGARPFGMVFGGGGGGGNFEAPQSIDYETQDFVAGVQFAGERNSFNLRASASFFRNGIDTMTVQNPLFVTLNGTNGLSPSLFTQGRFDLPPDNEAFNVKGEYAHAFPEFYRANLTATVALGSMRQDDKFIAPTQLALTGGTVAAGGASLANVWNTPDALSRQSADARIDTRLADVGLAMKPASALDVRAKLRYYETRNHTEYFACNPLTGQWGRLLNDGSGLSIVTANTTPGANAAGTSANAYNTASCSLAAVMAMNLAPATGNIPIASIPFDYRQTLGSVSADYRVGRASSVNASLEREVMRRDFRERDETTEDRMKLGYVDRGTIEGAMRISYEYDKRGGSDYNTNPYAAFTSAGFGPAPAVNTQSMATWFKSIEQFRSFDLADRTQNIVNGRVDYSIVQNLDGAISFQVKDAMFPAEFGRTGRLRANSATLDVSYQSGSNAVMYGFYTRQWSNMGQRGVHPNGCVVGQTYYFFSDGRVANANTGATAPATPPGTTLVGTQPVTAGNWETACASDAATSPLFPESRAWEVNSHDDNDVLGLGIKYDFGRMKLDASFTRMLGRTRIGYKYNAAALGMTPLQEGLASRGLSDLTFSQNILTASLLAPIDRNIAVRLLFRQEIGKIRDWHYDGVTANPVPANNTAFLDGGPVDYRDTLVGIFFQVRTP